MNSVKTEMFSQKQIETYWPPGVVCSAWAIHNQNVNPSVILLHSQLHLLPLYIQLSPGMYGVCVFLHVRIYIYV
jgi:hypothetical protein